MFRKDKPFNTLFLSSWKLFDDVFKPIDNPLILIVPKQVLKAVYLVDSDEMRIWKNPDLKSMEDM